MLSNNCDRFELLTRSIYLYLRRTSLYALIISLFLVFINFPSECTKNIMLSNVLQETGTRDIFLILLLLYFIFIKTNYLHTISNFIFLIVQLS